jgi:hypothetical protein
MSSSEKIYAIRMAFALCNTLPRPKKASGLSTLPEMEDRPADAGMPTASLGLTMNRAKARMYVVQGSHTTKCQTETKLV